MPVTNDLWKNMMKSSRIVQASNGKDATAANTSLVDTYAGQDGSPGFAAGIDRDLTLRPFSFTTQKMAEVKDMMPIPIGNFLRDLFKEIAPKLLRFPSATRNPLEMKGQKGWSELVDPVSALIPETIAPLGPISPDTRQRKLVPSRRGVKGISSHLNLIVDCSWSMKDSDRYAYLTNRNDEVAEAGGRMTARFVAALLIEQAKALGDSFSVFTFGGPRDVATTLTRGASRDYKGAVDYLLSEDQDFRKSDGTLDKNAAPFVPSNGTPLNEGIAACASTMIQNRDKIRGALTICILDGDPNGTAGLDPSIPNPGGSRYNQNGYYGSVARYIFDAQGAATEFIADWDYEDGTPNNILLPDQWNPRNDSRMWLNEERLRREFGPVLYVIVGSGNADGPCQRRAAQFNRSLSMYYNGDNLGIIQRQRTVNGETEFETEVVGGTDRRVHQQTGDWSPWTPTDDPPEGWGTARLSQFVAKSIRGPCSFCSVSFTISDGEADISRFGGSLLQLARAGKGGDLQRLCFTVAKR